MYTFRNQAEETAYRTALAAGNKQSVGCLIYVKGGGMMSNYVIVDSPSIDIRCVEDEDIFNVAEMYVGELNIRIKKEDIRAAALIGGSIKFYSIIETDEYVVESTTYDTVSIPCGVWDIADAKRDSKHFISIKANDRMAKLSTPMGKDGYVGMVTVESVMNRIITVLGAQTLDEIFAQTPAQIKSMFISNPASISFDWCTSYEPTCWDEIRLLAQMIGGFAFADREGKIRFRNFNDLSSTPVLEIPASKRFRADLQEGNFAVSAVTYTDDSDSIYTSSTSIADADTTSIICIDHNKYIMPPSFQTQEAHDNYYISIADNILGKISHIRTIPGSVDFYGDPSLDLGDMVLLTNTGNQGIGGSDVKFLITGIYWQFNGPQTITSAGAPSQGDYVSSSSSSGSHATPIPGGGSYASAANISTVPLTGYVGALFPTLRTVARTRFSNVTRAVVALECTMTIMGTDSSTVEAYVYVNNDPQLIAPKTYVEQGRYATLTFSLNLDLPSGIYDIHAKAKGLSELVSITGCVWGQNINAMDLQYSSDYTYIVDDGEATLTSYTGSATQIEIPEKLGNGVTTVIARESFKNKRSITTVYIPEGVETIE